MTAGRPAVLGLLLAGGLARRLGGRDKPLLTLAGKPLLAHGLARLAPQCVGVVLNANGDPARFAEFGLDVVPDDVPGFAGPLAGVLAGLDAIARRWPAAHHAVSLPVDTPFVPHDLVARLARARDDADADIAMAACGDRTHPAVALWPVAIRHGLRRALVDEDERSVLRFASRYDITTIDWPAHPYDPFFNINSPDDLAEAERIALDLIPHACEYGT